jgi:hypothetical protein
MANNAFSFCGPSGGDGGNHYSDGTEAGQFSTDDHKLVEVRIRSGAFIDAIQTVYEDSIGNKIVSAQHGGNGGKLITFKLALGEYITRISGMYGWVVNTLLIETNKGRAQGWGNPGGLGTYNYTAPPGTSIHGFFGKSGLYLDAIGVILKST